MEALQAAGYAVNGGPADGAVLKTLRATPPAAVIIDLNRRPSHGRDMALALRKYQSTRHVPLVLIGGDPAKLEQIKTLLPDATYTSWSRIRGAVKKAIANPPPQPVVPESNLAGYSGTPLPKKLGIKAHSVVALVDAPQTFEATLGDLPEGVVLRRQARAGCDLIIWFVKSRGALEKRIDRLGSLAGRGGLWIAWPKKASGITTDLSQHDVRQTGLAAGLVDYKVCAIDATWSGLRFVRRKAASSSL